MNYDELGITRVLGSGLEFVLDEDDIRTVSVPGQSGRILAAEYPLGLDYWRDYEILPPPGFVFDRRLHYAAAGRGMQLVGLTHQGIEGEACRIEPRRPENNEVPEA